MGRAARWLKGLFGMKKSKETQSRVSGSDCNLPVDSVFLTDTEKEQNKQAIAVATATASAAEAAVAWAQAAAAMVRQTSEGRAGDMDIITREERWAAVKVQKVFRGSLARKALRALKGIVKLQALVRGYLVRKRAAAMLQSIQALIRVQTAMRSKRINRCLNKEYNNMFQQRQSTDTAVYDERSLKTVEIDETYKKRSKSRQVHNAVAMSEGEDYGEDFNYQGNDLELSFSEEKRKYATAHSTPRFSSLSRHHAANNNRYYVTQSPAKSICGKALCDYGSILSSPGYMGNTQSFKAKVRSHSAPRQRSERKRLSLDEEAIASRSSVSGVSLVQQQRNSCSYDRF